MTTNDRRPESATGGPKPGVAPSWVLAVTVGVVVGLLGVVLLAGSDGGRVRVLRALITETAGPLSRVTVAFLGFVGLGAAVRSAWGGRGPAPPGSSDGGVGGVLVDGVAGAGIVSISALGLAGAHVLDQGALLLRGALVISACLVGAGLIRRRAFSGSARRAQPVEWLLLVAVGAATGFVLGGLVLSQRIHPDAMQYHLALPRSFAVSGGLTANETLGHDGTYLGFDILHLVVTDLDAPAAAIVDRLASLQAFSLLTGLVLLPATYALAREIGADRRWALLGAWLVLSVSSIARVGTMKNDVVTAAVAMVGLIAVARLRRHPSVAATASTAIVCGFAITVKLPNGAVVLPAVGWVVIELLVTHRTRLRELWPLVMLPAMVLPWVFRAYANTGNPLHPLFVELPPEAAELAAIRNANGLELTPWSFVTTWFDLVMDRYPVNGNDSMGIVFVSVFALFTVAAVGALLRRRGGRWVPVQLVAAAFFLAFSVSRFEGRFLTRYAVVVVGMTFASAAAATSQVIADRSRQRQESRMPWLPLLVLLLTLPAVWGGGLLSATRARVEAPSVQALVHGGVTTDGWREAARITFGIPMFERMDAVAGGGRVMINDQFTLFLDRPVVNVHSSHSATFDYARLDLESFTEEMRRRDVRAALLRPGISGTDPVVLQYLEACGIPDNQPGDTALAFVIAPACRLPLRAG